MTTQARIEALARAPARERQEATQLQGRNEDGSSRFGLGNFPAPERRESRDAVGAAVGMGGRQYGKAKAVVAAAPGGNVATARLLLDRLLGPGVLADIIERIELLEERIGVR